MFHTNLLRHASVAKTPAKASEVGVTWLFWNTSSVIKSPPALSDILMPENVAPSNRLNATTLLATSVGASELAHGPSTVLPVTRTPVPSRTRMPPKPVDGVVATTVFPSICDSSTRRGPPPPCRCSPLKDPDAAAWLLAMRVRRAPETSMHTLSGPHVIVLFVN